MSGKVGKNRVKRRTGRYVVLLAALLACIALAAGALYVWRHGLPVRALCPLNYKTEIVASAEEYDLDPCFVAAVINTESRFDKDAVSVDGAVGLMQLLPTTAEWIAGMRGVEYDSRLLNEPEYNIDMGCWLLRYLIDRYGSTRYALIAYNAGHGRLESWLADDELTDENGVLVTIPYGETDAYVKRVERGVEQYRKTYGEGLENAFN